MRIVECGIKEKYLPRKDTEYHGVYKGLDFILFFFGHG
jgi:hypothetical protein